MSVKQTTVVTCDRKGTRGEACATLFVGTVAEAVAGGWTEKRTTYGKYGTVTLTEQFCPTHGVTA